ncbi:MAG: hypothetical protein ACRD4E_03445 [Bryobacteraceae bacterium]
MTAYFLRRPRITSTAPAINTIALPADAGPISGALTFTAEAKPAIPVNSNITPIIFTIDLDLLLSDGRETTEATGAAAGADGNS